MPTPQEACFIRGIVEPASGQKRRLRRPVLDKLFAGILVARRGRQFRHATGTLLGAVARGAKILLHGRRNIATVPDPPDHGRRDTHYITSREDAIEVGHLATEINLDGPLSRDTEFGNVKQARHVFRIKTERLDHRIRANIEAGSLDQFGGLTT